MAATPSALQQPEETARDAVRKVHPWIELTARAGYMAIGVVYGLVGVLALLLAMGQGGRTTDQRGVLDVIGAQPFGIVLLYAIGIGLIGYAAWRFTLMIFNSEEKGAFKRLMYGAAGMVYGGLGISAFGAALGAKQKRDESDWVTTAMSYPLGRWMVAGAGAIILALAISQFVTAYKDYYLRVLKTEEIEEAAELKTVKAAAKIGLTARGVAFLVVAWFLFNAALHANPNEAGGLDEALYALAIGPFGKAVLGTVAAGFIAYGVYAFLEAKYRRIVPPPANPENPSERGPAGRPAPHRT